MMSSDFGTPSDPEPEPPRRPAARPYSRDMKTHWSVVQLLSGAEAAADLAAWQDAWSRLTTTYMAAMESTARQHLRRLGGAVRLDEAEDIVQDFLCECLGKNHLLRADRTIGKFRTFLAVLLRRYTTKYVQARNAKKRHPGQPIITLESLMEAGGLADAEPTDNMLGNDWVRCMVEAALPRVRCRSESNADLLRLLVLDPDTPNERLAGLLGIDAGKIALRKLRAKRMLAQEIWTEVKDTVSTQADFDQEREALLPFLSKYLTQDEAPSLWGLS